VHGMGERQLKAALDVVPLADAIERVVRRDGSPVHLHEPELGNREIELLSETIHSGWVSSGGKFVERFEEIVAEYSGVKHAIATVNGTTALHAALLVAGVQPNDEVLVPAITFVATVNAISHAQAVPHFADSSWQTLGLDPEALDRHLEATTELRGGELINRQTQRPIRALLPVHVFGMPIDVDGILAVAAKYQLPVIEDAAEAIGSHYQNGMCGSFGRCATLSFNGNKIITTGGGGMLLTNDADVAKKARHLTTTAKQPHAWEFYHDEVGYNYRLPNLNAALGCAQMERIDDFIAAKRRLTEQYVAVFRNFDQAHIVTEPSGSFSNYWLNTLVLDASDSKTRDDLLRELHRRKIFARPVWTPMHQLPMYSGCPRAPLPVAEDIFTRCVSLPSSPKLAGVTA
jgi:perosamine synthetase